MLKPMGSHILVAPKKKDEQTKSGIYIPGAKNEVQQFATIVSVGDGHISMDGTKIPLDFKEGDEILYAPYAGTRIADTDGSTYLMIDARDVLAKVIEKES